MMPAMRAVPSTSPFLALPETIRSSVAFSMTTRPSATASRSVAALSETSTIRASPEALIWVRAGLALFDGLVFGLVLDGLRAISACARGAGLGLAREQCARRRGDVGLPHQALADQE